MNLRKLALIIILCSVPVYGFAQLKGSTMGGLVTIVSDGPFDVARNPALMVMSTEKNNIGAILRYRPLDLHQADAEGPMDISVDYLKSNSAGVNFSYIHKFKKNYIGLTIGENGPDLFSFSKTEFAFTNGNVYEKETQSNYAISPTLGLSLCFPISTTSSFGFQVLAGNYYNRKELTKEGWDNPLTYHGKVRVDDNYEEAVGFSIGFGYMYRSGSTQMGILLRSGNFAFTREYMELTYYDYMPVASQYSQEDSTPYRFEYTGGVTVAAGAYQRISGKTGFALEGGINVQNSYTSRDLDVETDFAFDWVYIKEKKTTNAARTTVWVKGGVDYRILNNLTATAGAGYSKYEIQNTDKNFGERVLIATDIYLFTLGLHYALGPAIDISLACQGVYADGELRLDSSGASLDIDDNNYTVDVAISFSYRL